MPGVGGEGIVFGGIYNGVINRAFSSNNGGNGIRLTWDKTSVYSQIVTSNNNGYGVVQDNGDHTVFKNNFLVGNNSSPFCNVTGGTSPGISNSCGSAANLLVNTDVSNSFVGPLSSEDLRNQSDVLGLRAFSSIIDWINFDFPARVWGKSSLALDAAARGRCSSGNCKIWDFSLKSSDTELISRAFDGINPLSLVDQQPCPSAFSGSRFVYNASADFFETLDDGVGNEDVYCDVGESGCFTKAFLVDALEVSGDRIGNDDGLCESNETCIALPNLAYYNGHGDPNLKSCVFSDGSINGVTMKFYPSNGF